MAKRAKYIGRRILTKVEMGHVPSHTRGTIEGAGATWFLVLLDSGELVRVHRSTVQITSDKPDLPGDWYDRRGRFQ